MMQDHLLAEAHKSGSSYRCTRVGQGVFAGIGLGAAFFAGTQVAPKPARAPPLPDNLAALQGPQSHQQPQIYVEIVDPYTAIITDSLGDLINLTDIPEQFDTRSEWLGCGDFVVDQGQCGDCWAASATNTLGDRACIHLTADRQPINSSRGGALGVGATERLFQVAGRCTGAGSDSNAHQHGCTRTIEFPSPQVLVSCGNQNITTPPTYHAPPEGPRPGLTWGETLYPDNTGCNGGEAWDAWRFYYHEGTTSMNGDQNTGCTPYHSNQCSFDDPGNNGCRSCAGFDRCVNNGLPPPRTRVHSFGWIMEQDLPNRGNDQFGLGSNNTGQWRPADQWPAMQRQVRKMQIEMLANGPLHVCIDDYANFGPFFNHHASGIYNSTEGTPRTGGHCIELVGWGVDRLSWMPYWTFKNSWGPKWANQGFGRFIRGVDLCGFESDVWTGCPAGSNCQLTAGVVQNQTWDPSSPAPSRHPTSSAAPSRKWPGGKERQLSRDEFSHGSIAPLVEAAVRRAKDDSITGHAELLAQAERVWSRSMRGLRVRVQVRGVRGDWHAHRHIDGTIEAH